MASIDKIATKSLQFIQQATVTDNPISGVSKMYFKTDGSPYYKNSDGKELPFAIYKEGTEITGTSGALSVDMDGNYKNLSPTGDCTIGVDSSLIYGQECTFFIFTKTETTSWNITFDAGSFVSQGVLATGTDTYKVFAITFKLNSYGTMFYETSRTVAMPDAYSQL